MPLKIEHVEEIFTRLVARYGQPEWVKKWEGIDPAIVKRDWAVTLGGIPDEAIFHALDNLPATRVPPNASEFRKIAAEYRGGDAGKTTKRLSRPHVVANPQIVAREIAKMLDAQKRGFKAGRWDWAKNIVRRAQAGEDVPTAALDMAREALKVEIIPTPVPIVMAQIADEFLPPGMRKNRHDPPPPPSTGSRERRAKSDRSR